MIPRAEELAVEFDVSRTVVREALRVLAEKGLIESRQRSGTRVRERSGWNLVDPEVLAWQRAAGPNLQFLRDLSEVRLAIEPLAARLAALRATPEELIEIERLYAQMAASIDDPEAHARSDLDLHSAVLRSTHNELLFQMTNAISEALIASRDVTVRSSGAVLAAMPLHEEVVRSIAHREAGRAYEAMTELVNRALHDIEIVLGEGVDGSPRPSTHQEASGG